jgi:hypothetical protein
MLELTELKQQIQVLQGGSDTTHPPIHEMNQRNEQILNFLSPRIPVHMLHTRPDMWKNTNYTAEVQDLQNIIIIKV